LWEGSDLNAQSLIGSVGLTPAACRHSICRRWETSANHRRIEVQIMNAALQSTGRLSAFLLLLCSLTGCGLTVRQRTAVVQFSGATRDFAGLTANEFVQSRADVIEMNTFRAKLGSTELDTDRLDQHLTVERVKERVDAVGALQQYAELLQTLATSSKQEELKIASDSFVTNLRKVKGVTLSDEKAGAVGAAIQLVGGMAIEAKRARAVRKVVETTNPTVRQLLDLVERDFSPEEEYWTLGYDLVVSSLQRDAALARGRAATNDLAAAAVFNEARVLAAQNKTRVAAIRAQVLDVIKNLRQAQTELVYAVQSKEISIEVIQGYAARAEEFMSIYKILRQPN
jgi:hypothetical protein